ncbi:MAG: lipopolysaccharide biosynthesis protein [Aestuariivirga sp.]
MIARFREDGLMRQALGAGALMLVLKVLSAALSYLMFVVLANLLTGAEFGRFAFGFSLAITLGTIAGLGLATSILRFLPQYAASGDASHGSGFIRWSTTMTIVASLSLWALVTLGSWFIEWLRPELDLYYVRAAALLILPFALAEHFANGLRAMGSTIAALAPRDVLWRAAVPLAAILFVTAGYNLDGTRALLLAAVLIAALVIAQAAYIFPRYRSEYATAPPRHDTRTWINVSLPMWGAATLYALVQQFDVVVLGVFMSPEESGPYFAALRTAALLNLVLIAGNMASAPMIAKHYHAGDMDGLRKLIGLLTPAIAVPTLLGYVFLALIGSWLLSMFDPSFTSAYPLLLILAAGFTFDAIAGPTGYILQMTGNEKTYLAIMACCYAGTLLLQCLLIPHFGPYGAAIPTALGIVVANLLIIRAVRRSLGIDPSIFGVVARMVAR